jgi:MFS family permease
VLFAVVAVCILTVPLAGGRIAAFGDMRFEKTWLLLGAFGLQFAIFKIWPHNPTALHPVLYLVSYALGAIFLISNRRLPGLWLVGMGAGMNALVIFANGGVMPGAPAAFSAAGLSASPEQFVNSRAVDGARLLFLGDVFAVPQWLPFHNVFSIGDICIVMGAFIGLHRISHSRLLPSGTGQFTVALKEREFRRLWLAQAISNQGDWVYSLGVVSSLARTGATAGTLAILVVMQSAPRALASIFGGPFVDRWSRKKIMIVADVVRAMSVGSLVFAGTPSLTHLYAVAAFLGLFAALFQPSLQASIPNVVPPHRLVAANALVSVTFQLAVMVGPVVGGLLVAHLGLGVAFAVNATSFLVSGALIAGIHLPHTPVTGPTESPMHALREGGRYAWRTPVVRGVLLVTGLVMLAAAIRGPLEPLFLLRVLDAHPATLGLPAAIWGLGMLLGSSAAPAAAKAWSGERLLTASVALVGIAVLAASQSVVLSSLLCLWLVAGSGNAVGTIAYQSLLQQRTPDAMRGRIMAASEATLDIAYLVGVSAAGWLGSNFGLRWSLVVAGSTFLAAAVVSRVVLGTGPARQPVAVRRDPLPATDVVPVPMSAPAVARYRVRIRPLVPMATVGEPALLTPLAIGLDPSDLIDVHLAELRTTVAELRRREAVLLERLANRPPAPAT